jgi:transcriptional regulator with XRE-family HTH domain
MRYRKHYIHDVKNRIRYLIMLTETQLQHLGGLLREARKARGHTQEGLARLLNIPRLKVIQVEAGKPQVAVHYYADVAGALGQTLSLQASRRPTLDELQKLNAIRKGSAP